METHPESTIRALHKINTRLARVLPALNLDVYGQYALFFALHRRRHMSILDNNGPLIMSWCLLLRFCSTGKRDNMSLSSLSQQILGVCLDKDWKIRCSDWEAESLTERQVEYAANDAVIAERIFFTLLASKLREKDEHSEAGRITPDIGENNQSFCDTEEGNVTRSVDKSSSEHTCTSETTCDSENLQDDSFTCADISKTQETEMHESTITSNTSSSSGNRTSSENASSSNVGIVSSFLSTLGTISLDTIIGKPKPTTSEKPSTKVYKQYRSFEMLKVTDEVLAKPEIWSCLPPLCQGIVDLSYKTKTKQKNKDSGNEKTSQTSSPQVKNKASGLKPRRLPLYQNCVLEAPDGEMLSTCDKRKAEWYLVRQLADVVKEDPYTVRLRFEPSGRPLDPEHNYYLTFKENLCVVCGRDDSYMRKNIIPHDYRKHFPVCMKDHHSHDVLLLCPPCHMISCNHDDMLRRRLAETYDAPLASAQVARLIQDPVLKKVKSAAKALVYAGDKLPEKRREELLFQVKDFLGVEMPTQEMLVEAAGLEIRRENCNFVSHGREVVKKVKENDELLSFERMWREHFLATMKPKYLPPLWTVDHEQEKVKRLLALELNGKGNSQT